MRGIEVREWLDRVEHEPVPEPDAAFVARLEAQLRTMDQAPAAEPARGTSGRARWLVAAAPVAALTAAAAAAAVTLLPADPKPKHVTAADPGVTSPAPEPSPSTVPTPTTVAAAGSLPPAAPPPTVPPTTAAPKRATPGVATAPRKDSPATTAVVAPRTTETTVNNPSPTTTTKPPPVESMTLQCVASMPAGSPAVTCSWNQSASPQFRWYRLWRQSAGSSPTIVFQVDNRSTTSWMDHQVEVGVNYYYKLEVTDGSGAVIARSSVAPASCC